MPSICSLPLECLQLIIRHLANQHDCKTLASLLCVNKSICTATLPILFEDPCKGQLLEPFRDEPGMHERVILARRKLIRLMLQSLPADNGNVTELLQIAYFALDQDEYQDQGKTKTTTNSEQSTIRISTLFPYFSYITKITFEEIIPETHPLCFELGTLLEQPRFQAFLKETERVDQYKHEDPFHYSLSYGHSHCQFLVQAAEREIRRDLAWAFCHANAECIQTLHLTISDIGRYRMLIPRLKVLSDISFQIDKRTNLRQNFFRWLNEDDQLRVEDLLKERTRNLEEMVQFVEEHRRHHTMTLKSARCINDQVEYDSCPEEYQMGLCRLLPSLVRPLYLDHRNWHQFMDHVPETDLSFVRAIDFTKTVVLGSAVHQYLKQDLFLQRCRSLESLSLKDPDENIFRWAVQERKSIGSVDNKTDTTQKSLVPLRDFSVTFDERSTGNHVKDVLYAFNDTIESISIRFRRNNNLNGLDSNNNICFSLGDYIQSSTDTNAYDDISWLHFMRLKSLIVALRPQMSINLHPTFLNRCPNLETIKITRGIYNMDALEVATFSVPTELPNLLVLELSGISALSFDPSILMSTRKLRNLRLEACAAERFENEDVNDGRTTSTSFPMRWSVWTWEWSLPNLTFLSLCTDFAYQFQFRMLEETPCLRYLHLIINTLSRQYNRTIMIEDLIKPGFQHSQLEQFLNQERQKEKSRYYDMDNVNIIVDELIEDIDNGSNQDNRIWEEFEYVHNPSLEILSLNGKWRLDDCVIQVLFDKVAPHVRNLWFNGCYGYSLSRWIKSTSSYLHELSESYTDIPFMPQMITELGLMKKIPDNDGNHYSLMERPKGRLLDTPAVYSLRS
ncbi:hypothetical protein FBU30_005172 [Linnemannia zychae]|nr:hypothetical protein FBU30_005172 [Linnemannia zychae]